MPDNLAPVRVFESPAAVAAAVADALERTLVDVPASVLALATGRTPLAAYEELARRRRAGRVDMSRAVLVGIDEFVGVPPSQSGSFAAYLEQHLVLPLGVDPACVERLNGAASDLHEECARYERTITARGGIDVMLLGIGENGHIAFNEPADALTGTTHVVRLDEGTRRGNAARFGGQSALVPTHAVTMGMATILRSRRILLMATGADKAPAIAAALEGPLTTTVPASWLQTHRALDVFLDEDAASMLRKSGEDALRAG